MVKCLLSETKQPLRCQRCRGQVLRFSDDISCLQCGAPHTREGKLVTCSAQELGDYLPSKQRLKLRRHCATVPSSLPTLM